MHGLDFTPTTSAPFLIAWVAMFTTITRLIAALNDRRYLIAALASRRVSNAEVMRRMVRANIRREAYRLLKHLITLIAIGVSYTSPIEPGANTSFIIMRNWLACAVAVMLMVNSVLDYFAQRWAMRHFHPGQFPPKPPR